MDSTWKTLYVNLKNPNEVWEEVDLEGLDFYSVSNMGRIRNTATGKLAMPYMTRHGALHFADKNSGKSCAVHSLVAEYFVPNVNGYKYVKHVNGVKTDNRACNLYWSPTKHSSSIAVTCVETGRTYSSVFELAKDVHLSSAYVHSQIASGGKVLGKTYVPGRKLSSNPLKVKVICLETGQSFESMREASKKLNVPLYRVEKSVHTGESVHGLTFKACE